MLGASDTEEIGRLRPAESVIHTASAWAATIGGIAAIVALLVDPDSSVLFWTLIGVPACAAFIFAAYRVRLEVTNSQITVFNVRKTYRIPWNSVDRIGRVGWWLGPNLIAPGFSAIGVWTRSGERVVIEASTGELRKAVDLLTRFDPDLSRTGVRS